MKHVIALLKNELKISTKFPLIVSVSGGMDSMALLSMLIQSTYEIIVVHFNHLKRDESIIEKDLVESYCKKNEIPFHYYTIKVTEGNFHHQAHLLRNHYLCEVARMYKTPYILTAHHLDDLFENILIKMTRGSNLLGYAGMQMIHSDDEFTYIKPLLYTEKKDIHHYVLSSNIPYLDDSSNEGNYYLRNRYRHAVVPVMKQENEHLLDQIKQYHHQVTAAFEFIRNTTKSKIKENMIIPIEEFRNWDEAIKDDSIAYLIEHYGLTLTTEIILKIKKMILSKRPNPSFKLNKDYAFIKTYKEAYIKSVKAVKQVKIEIKEGKNKILNMAIFTFLNKSSTNTADFNKLCYNKLAFPLILRHREDGDLLAYDYGHKKLKKLLIDHKVPMEERNQLWVLTDQNDLILWVEKYYLNQCLGNENNLYFKYEEVKKNA
jgi:bifunctional protein TilS/HprT